MNKKGITPIIAIILLLMMTVAVAGAAFFWLSRIQNQLQGGVESFQGTLLTQVASAVDVVDADYNDTANELTIFLQNTGSTEIILENKTEFPTTTWILRDSNQVAICSSNWNSTSPAKCIHGCGPNSKLSVGEIDKVVLELAGSCDISGFGGGEVFSFTIDFSGKTTTSGSFVKH
ncbi:MAG: archaellin/type IV pilin N-terminal domain-containing protein [Candidatus Nanoarchaeia archaeon]